MAKERFEALLQKACADGVIPGAVVCATNSSGTFKHETAIGLKSLEQGKTELLRMDTYMWGASCTKLLTAISTMICVERGQIKLDDDLSEMLPELAKHCIVTGMGDDGTPETMQRKNSITLRRLLTHTSGAVYMEANPAIQAYQKYHGLPTSRQGPTVHERHNYPLSFEPGESWMYSTGHDWAGLVVERLNKISLEDFMLNEIFEPVGAKDMTFFPSKSLDIQKRCAHMSWREKPHGKVAVYDGPMSYDGAEACCGGDGAFIALHDYIKVLHSLLSGDGKILQNETVKEMFAPQLQGNAKTAFNSLHAAEGGIFDFFIGEFPKDISLDYALAGIVTMERTGEWRGKGLVGWGGFPNLNWFVDREHDLCGIFGTQVIPPGDKQVESLITAWEKALREMVKEAEG